MEYMRPSRSTCCHADDFLIVISTAADSPILSRARFLLQLFQHQSSPGDVPRDVAPHILTVGCTRLGGRTDSHERCRHVFPRFPITLTYTFSTASSSCCFCGGVHMHTATSRDLEYPLPLHTPRVPVVLLLPRVFSCCCSLLHHEMF